MLYLIIVILSFSILFPAVTSIARFKNIAPDYYPFIFCCWLGMINETASFLIARYGYSNIPNNNIYILAESILLLLQFRNWYGVSFNKRVFVLILCIFLILWLYDHSSITRLEQVKYTFRFFYALVIIILSIYMNQKLIIVRDVVLYKNPGFLICTGLILYFTSKILIDAAWLYKANSSVFFLQASYLVISVINFFVNILFAISVLWMPRKPHYIRS